MGIKKNRGRSSNTLSASALDVSADFLIDYVAPQVAIESVEIQAQLFCIRLKNRPRIGELRPILLISIEQVMHLPKLILITRRLGCMRRHKSVLVQLHQRKMM